MMNFRWPPINELWSSQYWAKSWCSRITALAICGSLLLLLGMVIFIQPLKKQLHQLVVEEQQLKAQSQQQARQYKMLKTRHDNRSTLASHYSKLVSSRLASPEKKDVLDMFTQLIYQQGLMINLFIPMRMIPHDFYMELPVKMNLSGSYQQMLAFFMQLATIEPMVVVDDFSMGVSQQPGPSHSKPDGLLTQVKVRLYFKGAGEDSVMENTGEEKE